MCRERRKYRQTIFDLIKKNMSANNMAGYPITHYRVEVVLLKMGGISVEAFADGLDYWSY